MWQSPVQARNQLLSDSPAHSELHALMGSRHMWRVPAAWQVVPSLAARLQMQHATANHVLRVRDVYRGGRTTHLVPWTANHDLTARDLHRGGLMTQLVPWTASLDLTARDVRHDGQMTKVVPQACSETRHTRPVIPRLVLALALNQRTPAHLVCLTTDIRTVMRNKLQEHPTVHTTWQMSTQQYQRQERHHQVLSLGNPGHQQQDLHLVMIIEDLGHRLAPIGRNQVMIRI